MKRFSFIVCLAVLCSPFVSCSRLDIDSPSSEECAVILKAYAAEWPVSHTSFGNDFEVLWSEGDSFALVSSDNCVSKFTLTSGSGTTCGTFSGTPSGTAPYYAVYPYSESVSISDGKLTFPMPGTQKGISGNILPGVSPSVARLDSESGTLNFRNTGSILSLTLGGYGTLSRMAIHELDGASLWGDVTVDLTDNSFATTVEGGSNTVNIEFNTAISYNRKDAVIYVAVPSGVFRRGFSATLYDSKGEAYSFIQTQADNKVARSSVHSMPKIKIEEQRETKDVARRGYYKDLFMDSGICLTSRITLHAAENVGFSYELFASSVSGSDSTGTTDEDRSLQTAIMVGDEDDENGALLYPDGSPRFRCIYVNGGSAAAHGKTLGEDGLERVRTFNANGGSYVGTCAGAYLGSTANTSYALQPYYFHLWPGRAVASKVTVNGTRQTMKAAHHRMVFEEGSPLLKYYSFPDTIGNVYHNGGCYMESRNVSLGGVLIPFPKETEVLMRYYLGGSTQNRDSSEVHMQASVWAYKKDTTAGRVVLCGSHPERMTSGVQLNLMSSFLLYATDGCGTPRVKGELQSGSTVKMDKKWSDGDPLHARIGDMQYHHFTLNVPESGRIVTLSLKGEEGDNLFLAMRKGGPAWLSDADFTLCNAGATKQLVMESLAPGEYFVSVFCPDKPQAYQITKDYLSYYKYLSNVKTQNGIPYELSLTIE